MSNRTHRRFKERVAVVQVSVFPLKYDTISFIPNAPASTHHGLFEKLIGRSVIGINDHIDQVKVQIPFFTNFPPKGLAEVTFEK
jgi:hypothetical protein